jgi:hypothetical protein
MRLLPYFVVACAFFPFAEPALQKAVAMEGHGSPEPTTATSALSLMSAQQLVQLQ